MIIPFGIMSVFSITHINDITSTLYHFYEGSDSDKYNHKKKSKKIFCFIKIDSEIVVRNSIK